VSQVVKGLGCELEYKQADDKEYKIGYEITEEETYVFINVLGLWKNSLSFRQCWGMEILAGYICVYLPFLFYLYVVSPWSWSFCAPFLRPFSPSQERLCPFSAFFFVSVSDFSKLFYLSL